MKNWGGNVTYGAAQVHRPTSLAQLHDVVTTSQSMRCLGSRHSFNTIADGDTILDTSGLPEFVEIGADRTTVTVNGSMTYGRLAELLRPLGFALHNLASLPHISIAGAIATGTHGSGDGNGNLATAVAGLQVMRSNGEVQQVERIHRDFDGCVVSLGLLGVVTAVTLDVEPDYLVEQRVYEGITIDELAGRVDEIFGSGYSVSAFTRWRDVIEQVWIKSRTGDPSPGGPVAPSGLVDATEKRHPIVGLDASASTEQFGTPGRWSDRLPHFEMAFTPSVGDEIQSEFFVDRRDSVEAIRAVATVGEAIHDALLVSEIRTIAADTLWMSPHVGRDSLAFHFTWTPDAAAAADAARRVAEALLPFDPRPHWGKVFPVDLLEISTYRRAEDFVALADRFDPAGMFRNRWFDEVFG